MGKRIIALGFAGAMAAVMTAPSYATPMPTATATVKTVAPDTMTGVRWGGGWRGGGWGWRGGWGHGWWWPGAVVGGLALGGAIAASPYYCLYGYGCGYPYTYYHAPYWRGYPGYGY